MNESSDMGHLHSGECEIGGGEYEPVVPKPRDSEVDRRQRAEFESVMREAGAQLLQCGIGSDALNVTVNVSAEGASGNRSNPSPHDVLSYKDIMELEKCGDTKARLILQSIPKSYKSGRSRHVLRRDYEEWCSSGAAKKVKWPKRNRGEN